MKLGAPVLFLLGALLLTLTAGQIAEAAVTVTRADMELDRLRVRGQGAGPQATILIDGLPLGQADDLGNFRIEVSGFSSPTCVITVSDGSTVLEVPLSNCTVTPPPGSAPTPPPPSAQLPVDPPPMPQLGPPDPLDPPAATTPTTSAAALALTSSQPPSGGGGLAAPGSDTQAPNTDIQGRSGQARANRLQTKSAAANGVANMDRAGPRVQEGGAGGGPWPISPLFLIGVLGAAAPLGTAAIYLMAVSAGGVSRTRLGSGDRGVKVICDGWDVSPGPSGPGKIEVLKHYNLLSERNDRMLQACLRWRKSTASIGSYDQAAESRRFVTACDQCLAVLRKEIQSMKSQDIPQQAKGFYDAVIQYWELTISMITNWRDGAALGNPGLWNDGNDLQAGFVASEAEFEREVLMARKYLTG